MARYMVSVVVLLALAGGYVAGQQPSSAPELGGPSARLLTGEFPPSPSNRPRSDAQQVGRYVPTVGGRILDTTDGTLYAASDFHWAAVVMFKPPAQAGVTAPSSRTKLRDR